MKITLDIEDALLLRAKEAARAQGRSLSAVVEEGLRQVLASSEQPNRYALPDCSGGDSSPLDPIENYSWQDLRDIICEDRDSG